MGRTTAAENKSVWIKFRIKPSLRKRILEIQAQGDFADGAFQDYLVMLIRRGMKVHEVMNQWAERLTIDVGKKELEEASLGGAAANRRRGQSSSL